MSATNPLVSVIVPANDAEGELPALLGALGEQTLESKSHEVVVADDASRDRTAEVAREGGARLVRAPRRGGSYAARNLGIDVARGEVLAFTDADCRPAPDWLERGLAALEREEADLVSGRVEMPLGPSPSAAEMLSASVDMHQAAFVWAGWGATANLFVHRRVLARIGRFNDGLVSAGDVEFGMRAREAGFAIWYAPEAVVLHPPRTSAMAVVRKAFRTGFGQAQLVHGGVGPASDPGFYRTRPGDLLPPLGGARSDDGAERLRELGHEPSDDDLRRLALGGWLLGSWPRFTGYALGSLAARVSRRP